MRASERVCVFSLRFIITECVKRAYAPAFVSRIVLKREMLSVQVNDKTKFIY